MFYIVKEKNGSVSGFEAEPSRLEAAKKRLKIPGDAVVTRVSYKEWLATLSGK